LLMIDEHIGYPNGRKSSFNKAFIYF